MKIRNKRKSERYGRSNKRGIPQISEKVAEDVSKYLKNNDMLGHDRIQNKTITRRPAKLGVNRSASPLTNKLFFKINRFAS